MRFDIGIAEGQIKEIGEAIEGSATSEIDAGGNLVTESFVNTHLHLCKVYTLEMMDEGAMKDYHGADMGKAMTAIELAAKVKEGYDESWIIKNVRRAMKLSAKFGCTHTRAFADVDTKARLEGVKALIRAREEFRGVVDIQVVAFAQDGIVREPGAADLIRQAMDLGADVVGGIPWIEFTDADIAEHVRVIFDTADDLVQDPSQDGKGLHVPVIVDGALVVGLQMERVDHVNIAQIGRGRLVGGVDRMAQGEIPDGEGFELGIAGSRSPAVFVVDL